MTERRRPQAAYIEIVERPGVTYDETRPGTGIVRANELRINGTPIRGPMGESIKVHGMTLPGDSQFAEESLVRVTVTMFARRVVLGSDADLGDYDADPFGARAAATRVFAPPELPDPENER